MKIAIISIFQDGYGGGCGRVAHDMADHFSTEHEVLLIRPAGETRLYERSPGLLELSIESVGEGQASMPDLSRKNVNAMYNTLDDFTPDVVHAHEPASLGLMAQVWAAMNGVPFVYTAHVLPTKTLDFGIAEIAGVLSHPWTESVTRRLIGEYMNSCDAVIALNAPAAADIKRSGYQGKLFTIPNARDVERLGALPIADTDAPTKTLTFVGLISQRKNQRYLLEVLRQLDRDNVSRHYRLQIVGDALEPRYGAELQAWAAAEGIENVVWTGAVPYAEIPELLSQTHVFVSASKMEVQSLAVIEALASGTPVVGLSNETVDELVDEDVGGWFAADTEPEVFARRVQQICELSQEQYAQMCAHARCRVAHLSWSHVRTRTVEAYQALLDARSEAGRPEDLAEAQIMALVARIPSPKVRRIVHERLTRLNRTLREQAHLRSQIRSLEWAAHAGQVSNRTWIYVGATRAASSLLGGMSRLAPRRVKL